MGAGRQAEAVWAGSLQVLLPARAREGGQRTRLEGGTPQCLVSDGYKSDGLSLFCVF